MCVCVDVPERILDVSLLSLEGNKGGGYVQIAILSCTTDELKKVTYFQLENSFADKSNSHCNIIP